MWVMEVMELEMGGSSGTHIGCSAEKLTRGNFLL